MVFFCPYLQYDGEGGPLVQRVSYEFSFFSPTDCLDKTMKDLPTDYHIVVESLKGSIHLYAVGYKYSSKKVLCFISTEGWGLTLPGKTYEALWMDWHANVHSFLIPPPQLVSSFLTYLNNVYGHNKSLN